ncbi:MAG: MFS transporter [Micromonosporaceae bacterium]
MISTAEQAERRGRCLCPREFYGLLLSLNALVIVVAELPLTRFTERRPPLRVIAVGLVLLGIGFGLTGLSRTEALLLAVVLVWTVAEMIYTPVAAAYPGLVSPEHLRGRYQGAEALAHTTGQVLGPMAGGALYGFSSWPALDGLRRGGTPRCRAGAAGPPAGHGDHHRGSPGSGARGERGRVRPAPAVASG